MVDEEAAADAGALALSLEVEVNRPVVRLHVVGGPRNHERRGGSGAAAANPLLYPGFTKGPVHRWPIAFSGLNSRPK